MNFAEHLFKYKTIEKIPPAFVLILAEATLSIAGKSLIFGRAAKYNSPANNVGKYALAKEGVKLMIFVLVIATIFSDKEENRRLVRIAEKYLSKNLPE